MNHFMDDSFINKRVFSKLVKNVEDGELQRAMEELDYLNEVRKNLIKRHDLNPIQTEFTKKVNNARKHIQV